MFKVVLTCLFVCALCETSRELTLIDQWINQLPFPLSVAVSDKGNLAAMVLVDAENFEESGGAYAHTRPPALFRNQADSDQLLLDIGGHLRRGVNRFRTQVAKLLPTVKPTSMQYFIYQVRAVLHSFSDFYTQVNNTLALGPSQLEALEEHAEYGPETNFWVKFRPYLSCNHMARVGPEFGGIKNWCNPEWFNKNKPKFILSGGSGGDFAFEDTLLAQFDGSKVVTIDCFMPASSAYNDPKHPRDPSRLIYVEECLHGPRDEDLIAFRSNPSAKVSTFPDFFGRVQAKYGITHFDLHKLNIEAFEYPTYGHIMTNPDQYAQGLKQIHMEMHRHGMADHGLCWDSLLLSELLWATMYSGGFHAVATEKWHDSTSASDVVFVNQTWYLEAELSSYESTMEDVFPMERKADEVTRDFDWDAFKLGVKGESVQQRAQRLEEQQTADEQQKLKEHYEVLQQQQQQQNKHEEL